MYLCSHSIYEPRGQNSYYDDISINEIKKINKNFHLTFDDGYLSIYKYKEILCNIKNKIILFICPGFIEGDTNIWWFELLDFINKKNSDLKFSFRGKDFYFSLKTNKEREFCYKKLSIIFKKINQRSQQELLNIIIKKRKKIDYRKNFLTWEMIYELSQCPNISIGSHTYSHPNLKNEDKNKVSFELKKSKEVIEKNIKKECSYLAFPYGGNNSFDNKIIDKALEIGYKNIFTTEPKINFIKKEKQIIINRLTSSPNISNDRLWLYSRYLIKGFKNILINNV